MQALFSQLPVGPQEDEGRKRRNVRISAAGMEYSTPISPNAFGSSITSGTASRTSRKNDSPADSTGLPHAPA